MSASYGYLYAILFDTGAIKIGTTSNLHARMRSHASDARHYGVSIQAIWHSVKLADPFTAEGQWLGRLWPNASLRGSEYLQDRDFDAVIELAGYPAFYSSEERHWAPERTPEPDAVFLNGLEAQALLKCSPSFLYDLVRRRLLRQYQLPTTSAPRYLQSEIEELLIPTEW